MRGVAISHSPQSSLEPVSGMNLPGERTHPRVWEWVHDMPGTKYSADVRARAVRLVREHAGDYPSEWAAMTEVAKRLGIGSAETLRKWVR